MFNLYIIHGRLYVRILYFEVVCNHWIFCYCYYLSVLSISGSPENQSMAKYEIEMIVAGTPLNPMGSGPSMGYYGSGGANMNANPHAAAGGGGAGLYAGYGAQAAAWGGAGAYGNPMQGAAAGGYYGGAAGYYGMTGYDAYGATTAGDMSLLSLYVLFLDVEIHVH